MAGDEEQFGKRVEEINFFAQLSNSRGCGISVIGDSEYAEQIRRVMLPWYAPSNQRTFLFAASGRELRRFNEIALGLVLLAAALICQFTSITNTHIGR